MRSIGLLLLAFSVFLTACDDPSANATRALTGDASSSATAPANPKGEALTFSGENSKVLFTGSKVTGKHDGGFNKFDGTIDLVNNKPEESSVRVNIDTASVFTDADGLTKHLQTGDFFEVSKHPKATFVSTKIVPDAAKGPSNYTVTGDLELRGVRKSVTFPATINVSPEAVTVDSEFSINRKDFGIAYPGKPDDLIRDGVVIRLDLNASRKR